MTRDDVIKMARGVGAAEDEGVFYFEHGELERFAALVAACEREAQPMQKLVAWRFHDGETWCYLNHIVGFDNPRFQALYTAPVRPSQPRSKPSLTCAKCGVDRMREACKQPGPACPFMGEAQ